jgi:hypothetical protein
VPAAIVDVVEAVGVRLVVGGLLWALLCIDESPTAPAWLASCEATTIPVRDRMSSVKQRIRALLLTSAVFIPFFLLSWQFPPEIFERSVHRVLELTTSEHFSLLG